MNDLILMIRIKNEHFKYAASVPERPLNKWPSKWVRVAPVFDYLSEEGKLKGRISLPIAIASARISNML